MSLQKFLVFLGLGNIVLMALILGVYFLENNRILKAAEQLVEEDIELLVGFNELYAQGLQTGQATRNLIINPVDGTARENYDKAHGVFLSTLERLQAKNKQGFTDRLREIEKMWQVDHLRKMEVQQLAQDGSLDKARALIKEETAVWRGIKEQISSVSPTSVKILKT